MSLLFLYCHLKGNVLRLSFDKLTAVLYKEYMKIIRQNEVPKENLSSKPIFFGGEVMGQPLVDAKISKNYNFTLISFAAGARNKFHAHTSDQILYVTKGTGIVATEKEEAQVNEGDVILIPAGEKHWHGATTEAKFAHISLLTLDSKTQIFD